MADVIRARLELSTYPSAPPRVSRSDEALDAELRRFYALRRGLPAWTLPEAPQGTASALLLLSRAARDGLDPAAYGARTLLQRWVAWQRDGAPAAERSADLDLAITRAVLAYAGDLAFGRVDPQAAVAPWFVPRPELDPAVRLAQAVQGRSVASLASLAPRDRGYRRLRAALARLRAGGPRPPEDDGGMQLSDEQRIRLVELNLERRRWLPRDLGTRYVLVNIPEFRLTVVDSGVSRLTMRVIVGKSDHPTPPLTDRITYLDLNPTWNVPEGIAESEILPAVLDDPGYLKRHGMQVVRGWDEDGVEVLDPRHADWSDLSLSGIRFRQLPGPGNSLGRVRFGLPNPHDIYLHDTPAERLFERSQRSLSHGCVRLENPLELAVYALRDDPDWDRRALAEAIATGKHVRVVLPRPLPVVLVYWTAWVDPEGILHFRPDVYGRDDRLARALGLAPPTAAGQSERRAALGTSRAEGRASSAG